MVDKYVLIQLKLSLIYYKFNIICSHLEWRHQGGEWRFSQLFIFDTFDFDKNFTKIPSLGIMLDQLESTIFILLTMT